MANQGLEIELASAEEVRAIAAAMAPNQEPYVRSYPRRAQRSRAHHHEPEETPAKEGR